MRSFRLDPYLWVHLAGLAMLPILFSGCLLGLAVGEPLLSVWIEMGVLVGLGVVPILWMQLQRPFYIFSLVFVAIRPESLSDERLRLLRLFKTPSLKVVSAIAPIPLVWVLWQIYGLAPVASELTPLTGLGRLGGVLVAAFCFGLCNLFFQVPVSVVRVMAATSEQLAKIPPYEPSQIEANFSAWGLWVDQILPDLVLPNRGGTPEQPPLSEEVASADTSLSPEPLAELRVDASDLVNSDFDNDDLDDLDANDALDLEPSTSIDPSPIEPDHATDSELAQGVAEAALAPLVDAPSEAKGDVLEETLPLHPESLDDAQSNGDAASETSESIIPVPHLGQTDAPQAVADSEVSSLPMEAVADLPSDSDDGGDWVEAPEIPAAEPQEDAHAGESSAEVELATDGEHPNEALILEADTEDSATPTIPSQPDEVDTPEAQVPMDSEVGNNDDTLEVLQGEVTLESPLEVGEASA